MHCINLVSLELASKSKLSKWICKLTSQLKKCTKNGHVIGTPSHHHNVFPWAMRMTQNGILSTRNTWQRINFSHISYTHFAGSPFLLFFVFFSYLLQLHRKRWHPLVSFHLKFNQMNHGVDGSFWVEQCNATQCHRTWKCRGQKLCSLFDFRVTQKLIDREKWHV